MFENWAMPVVNKRWGVAAVVLDWMKRSERLSLVRPCRSSGVGARRQCLTL